MSDLYAPKPEHKFTFGLWTVGNPGRDPFGEPVRADEGQTWTIAYVYDSIDFTAGSGVLQYPDIVYNIPNDLLFLAMVDPNAEMYNNEVSFIPGDIASGGDASWYGMSFTGCVSYTYAAATCTNNFFLSLTTQDGYEQIQGLMVLASLPTPILNIQQVRMVFPTMGSQYFSQPQMLR